MESTHRLQNKVAVITGATRGIGAAIARRFAEEGARLAINGRDPTSLEERVDELRTFGIEATSVCGDVAERGLIERLAESAESKWGNIDIWVNNAAIYHSGGVLDCDLSSWKRVMDVNVTGTFLGTQIAMRYMNPRRAGKIVNLSSIAGQMATRCQAAYGTSKHAVIGLTRCAAIESADYGVSVNAVCPGIVDTDMASEVIQGLAKNAGASVRAMRNAVVQGSPIQRLLTVREVANVVLFLASSESDGMTGQVVNMF